MSVPTQTPSPSPRGFSDRRDPAVLGWALLVRSRESKSPLSEVYDRYAALLERVPARQDDGLMSNDPELHHSKTSQTPAPGGSK